MKRRWKHRHHREAPQRRADAATAIAAWRVRQCWVCGAARPCIGFGPPLLPAGETVWACSAACADVMEDAMIGAATDRARLNALLVLLA